MEKVRIGLVGCGVIGRTHARPAVDFARTELVAVADLLPERAKAYADEFGVAQVFGAGDELIDRAEIDAVVLALPACERTALGLHALGNGKHLLTEKPVAMSAAEVEQLIAAKGDLVAACCSSRFRFMTSAKVITETVASGVLGDLRLVRCRAIIPAGKPPQGAPPEWRLKRHLNGGGILMNWGCYDLDYLLGITGWSLQPEAVMAQTWSISDVFANYAAPGSEAETHVAFTCRFAGGPALHYERGEFVSSRGEGAWSLIGTAGALHLNMLPGQKRIELDRGVPGEGVTTEVLWEGQDASDATMRGPLEDFATAILDGGEPSTTLERALIVQQISDAVYRSAEVGAPVAVG